MNTNEVMNVVNEPINDKPKKKSIFPIIILIVAILIISILVVSYYNEQKALKGKEFVSLLTRDQYIVEMFKKDENVSRVGETNYSFIFYNDSGEAESIDASVIVQDGILDGKVHLKSKGEEELLLEFIKEDNTFALYMPDSYDKFIAVSSENGVELAQKFGYDFSLLEDKEAMQGVKDLFKGLATRYEKVLADAVGKYVKVKKDKNVVINGETHEVEIYELSLDIKSFANIYRDILGEVRTDTDALAVIVAVVANANNQEVENVYQEVFDNIESQYFAFSLTGLIDESENEDLMDIVIYAENGKALKIQLIAPDSYTESEIFLEATSNGNKDYAKFGAKDITEEASFTYNAEKSENNYSGEIRICATNGEEAVTRIISEKLENQTREARKVEETNHILLNEATDEELDDVCQKVFGMSLEEFAKSNMEDDVEYNAEEKAYLTSDAYTISEEIQLGMTKQEVTTLMEARDVKITENIDGNITIEKAGTDIVSVYFNKEGKVELIYNHIFESSKF